MIMIGIGLFGVSAGVLQSCDDDDEVQNKPTLYIITEDIEALSTYGGTIPIEFLCNLDTPAGVMELLDEYKIDPKGKECVVVGRSNIVGKPMSMLLLHRHGTVTICHSRTQDLAEVCRRADILVAAVGKAGFITPDMVKEGAVVIDVGINRNAEGKVCGDVAPEVMEKASYMTPVPGGAGPMTITMLMKNTLKAAKLQHGIQ